METKKIKILADTRIDDKPVKEGQVVDASIRDAQTLVEMGKAEYAHEKTKRSDS